MKRIWGPLQRCWLRCPPSPATHPPVDGAGHRPDLLTSGTTIDRRRRARHEEFITAIGESKQHRQPLPAHPAQPFRATDPPGTYFEADCADLPYVLRFYYAWKRGLPFAYVSVVQPRGWTRDMRYARAGNAVAERVTPESGRDNGYTVMQTISDTISTATFRIHPDLETPLEPDFYSPAITPKSIRPGTMIYDPNGHVATVYKVDPDGRIHYVDAHPDNAMTRGYFDQRFVRAWPAVGAGFKNWRPVILTGYAPEGRHADRRTSCCRQRHAIPDFSVEQFFGNRPARRRRTGRAAVHAEQGGDGLLRLCPRPGWLAASSNSIRCARCTTWSIELRRPALPRRCRDPGAQRRHAEPRANPRLPPNIYGTDGDWETYSTPSRDAPPQDGVRKSATPVARFMALYLTGRSAPQIQGRQSRGRHA